MKLSANNTPVVQSRHRTLLFRTSFLQTVNFCIENICMVLTWAQSQSQSGHQNLDSNIFKFQLSMSRIDLCDVTSERTI